MFEAAELGHKVDKESYKAQLPALREALLDAQYELRERGSFPVIILINGVDGAGKGETVNLLNEWMDPRLIDTHAFGDAGLEEYAQPAMWRFWRALPARGRIGILFGSWYTLPILNRVVGKLDKADLRGAVDDIVRFEDMLCHEGALLLKFWFHLGKKQQKSRLKALEADPLTQWRVREEDWEHYKQYDEFRDVSEQVLLRTSTGHAPWVVVDGEDERYRSLTVGKLLLQALRSRLEQTTPDSP
ncbi:MAG: polyphosphate:AMP phosphotransferase, partial [Chitinimonas sp.]|nr:polyphosphate:AMP phosphotransferase [Chitinimonas sp.]